MTVTAMDWQTEPHYALNIYGLIDAPVRRLIADTTAAVRAAGGRVRHAHWEHQTGTVIGVTDQGRWVISWDHGARTEETALTVCAPFE